MKKSLMIIALICVSAMQYNSSTIAHAENVASLFGCGTYPYPVVSIIGVDCAHPEESLYYTVSVSCGIGPYNITWGASNGDTGTGYSFTTTMPASGTLNVWVVALDSQPLGGYADKYTLQNSDCGGGTINN